MRVLSVNFNNINMTTALEQALSLLEENKKSRIFFLNADCLYRAQNDDEYRYILNTADLVLPDGVGLRLIVKWLGSKLAGNCNGTDFSPLFLARTTQKGYKVFFLGGRLGTAEKAAENLRRKIPEIRIVGTHSGYLDNETEVINKINHSGADILFVAMGVPIQEKWINRNLDKLNPRLCLGVGGLFDYIAGNVKRAPKIIRIIQLEWLWRIAMEPKRLWRRYLVDDIKLFRAVIKQKYGNGNNKEKK